MDPIDRLTERADGPQSPASLIPTRTSLKVKNFYKNTQKLELLLLKEFLTHIILICTVF